MTFNCTFSVWDYEEAFRLHRRQNTGRRVRFLFLYQLVPVMSVAGLVLLGAYGPTAKTLPGWLVLSFASALLWAGIATGLASRNLARRRFRQNGGRDHCSVDLDDERVLIQVHGVSEMKRFWNGFVAVARNDKIILLYTSKDCFVIFPLSAMSAEQTMELTTIIQRNLTRK
jgi:hypothetical protein